MFNGKKTYVTAAVSLLYAGWGAYTGSLSANEAFQIVQVALVGAFLRQRMA